MRWRADLADGFVTADTAMDAVGPGKTEHRLVKLARLDAHALADPALFRAHIDAARKDL